MSIIEVLVALAIMSIVMLAFVTMTDNANNSVSYMEDRLSRVEFESQMRQTMSKVDSCTSTVAGYPATTSPQNIVIRDKDGNKIVDTSNATLAKFDRLKILKSVLQLPAAIPNNDSGTAKITFALQRVRTGGGPTEFQPFDVPILVSVDNAGKITGCEGSSIGGSMTLIPSRTLLSYSQSNAANPSGTRIFNTFQKIVSPVIVPANATHAIIRFMFDVNTISGNVSYHLALGPSLSNLDDVGFVDTSSGTENDIAGMKFVPLDATKRVFAEIRMLGVGNGDIGLRLYIDGFIVSN